MAARWQQRAKEEYLETKSTGQSEEKKGARAKNILMLMFHMLIYTGFSIYLLSYKKISKKLFSSILNYNEIMRRRCKVSFSTAGCSISVNRLNTLQKMCCCQSHPKLGKVNSRFKSLY